MNFHIHNLIKFKVSGVNRRYLDYLSKEYSFFKTDEPIDPDVEVVITDAIEPNGNCRLVDNKYFIRDGYLYCRDRYKVMRWSLSIDGLERKTVVSFSGGLRGEYILKDFIIEPLLGFKLAAKGFSMLHASAIAIDDKGVVFTGGPESGKTTSILSLNAHNNTFLSDEVTIFSSDGVIYSLPLPIRIYNSHLKGITSASHKMTCLQKLEVKMKHCIYLISLGYAKLPTGLRAESLFERAGGVYPLRCLVLLTRVGGGEVTLEEITDKGEFVERLVLINEQQFPYWFRYIKAYSSVYPSSQVATYSQRMRARLSETLAKVPCYEIKTPRRFSERQRREFQQLMQTLRKGL